MTKVVYNACYGGFGLSEEGMELYNAWRNESDTGYQSNVKDIDLDRHDPLLVQVVETLGETASATYADLRVQHIQGSRYLIQDYDGLETVVTPRDMRWVRTDGQVDFIQSLENDLIDALRSENSELVSLLRAWLKSGRLNEIDYDLLTENTEQLVNKDAALEEMARLNQALGLYEVIEDPLIKQSKKLRGE